MAPRNVVLVVTHVAASVLLVAHLVFGEGQLPTTVDTIHEYDVKKVVASNVSTILEEEKSVEFLGGILRISNFTKPKVKVNGRMLVRGTITAASIFTTRGMKIGN